MKSSSKIKLRDVLNYTNIYTFVLSVENEDFDENIRRSTNYQNFLYYQLGFQDLNLISNFVKKEEIEAKKLEEKLRIIIKKILKNIQPINLHFLLKGPKHFLDTLSKNELQCFKNAGLLNKPPDNQIINWWDELKAFQRKKNNEEKVVLGRIGEKKTLEYENNKLNKLKIDKKPSWDGFDDDTLGYDILSYDEKLNQIYIECKYSDTNLHKFYLSRNEYKKSLGKKNYYYIHYWNKVISEPIIIDYNKLQKLVLENKENTEWINLEIKNF